jgi:hypothetical protein
MIIAVAGPYSAASEEQRRANLEAMNGVAARLLEMGHVPVIGVNAALPVMKHAQCVDPYEAIMRISLAVVRGCDALLLIGESPGANRERDLILAQGKPVYRTLEEIPAP